MDKDPNEFLYISGYEECSPLYDLRRKTFPYLTLGMIARSGGKLVLNEQEFDIHPGFCFCTGPGVSFHLQASKTQPLNKYFIAFGHEIASSDIRASRLYPGFVYRNANPATLEKWNELILEEGISQSAKKKKNVMSLVHVLVRKITPSTSLRSKSQSADALVERVLREIETNFRELGTLQEIADRFGVTSEHLCRVFKANHKISPYKILSRRKMEHAYAQLKMSETPIHSDSPTPSIFLAPSRSATAFRHATLADNPSQPRSRTTKKRCRKQRFEMQDRAKSQKLKRLQQFATTPINIADLHPKGLIIGPASLRLNPIFHPS